MTTIEFIRGLGLGGAEALLVNRLSTVESRARGLVRVVNTYPGEGHYQSFLEGVDVDVRTTAVGPFRSSLQAWRYASLAGDGALLVSHSPSIGIVLKLRRALGIGRSQILVDVVHNSKFRRVYQVLARLLNRYADLALCVGNEVAESPGTRGYRAMSVVHGGVPTGEFSKWFAEHPEHRRDVRKRFDVPEGGRLLMAVGGLTEVKNHDLAVRSMSLLSADDRMIVIGEGERRQELEQLAKQLGVNVHFVGRQPAAWQWMGSADVLVHTSLYEGLPVVLMEAAAQGLPVAATPFEGALEVAGSDASIAIARGFTPSDLVEAITSLPVRERTMPTETYWGSERFAHDFYSVIDDIPGKDFA